MGTYAISGSASGIGAATRRRLEASGHRVIGIDLREADVIADLAISEGRGNAVASVLERSEGVIDGLVTAAGLSAGRRRRLDHPGQLLRLAVVARGAARC